MIFLYLLPTPPHLLFCMEVMYYQDLANAILEDTEIKKITPDKDDLFIAYYLKHSKFEGASRIKEI